MLWPACEYFCAVRLDNASLGQAIVIINFNLSFMKQNFSLRYVLRWCILPGALACFALGASAQQPYTFQCKDYVSTDDNRAPQSSFSYNEEANTFTITASGTNNIAFEMDKQKDGAYYIRQSQTYFVVQGTNLNTTTSTNSYIWWFNGYNNYGQTPCLMSAENSDGSKVVVWDIKNTAALSGNMNYDNPTLIISSNGKSLIHAMGLTSSSGASTISNIGYYAKYALAGTYPALINSLGYTEVTLTAELREVLSQTISDAQKTIEGDAESAEKAEMWNAINTAQGVYDATASDDNIAYATVFDALNNLQAAVENYEQTVVVSSYEQTETGVRVKINELYVNLMLYADDILRVVKTYGEKVDKKSLSVVATPSTTVPFEVTNNPEDNTVTLATSKLKAICYMNSGQVEVLRYNGSKLIGEAESGTSMLAKKDGPFDSYQISTTFRLDDDEQIFGMGQIQDGLLNRRGQTFSLTQDNMKVCIPYFQSTKNYALFWDNYSPTTFTDNKDGTRFQSTGKEIDYYVLSGDDSNGVLASMRKLTGHSPMPALWNFGLYQSKERYTSTTEVKEVVDKYRTLGVPIDCIVQDWQYWGENNSNWNALEFLNPKYADAEDMIQHVHDKNAKLMISIWANFGPATKPYDELNKLGRLIPINSYPWNNGVQPYDVYDENARNIYWKYLYNGLVSKGIDAYWMDSTEPDYTNWQEKDLDYVSGDGRTWRSLRNAFPIAHVGGVATHHRTCEEADDTYLKGKRVSILTRSAFAGQQRYGANTWSGDVTSSWTNFAAQIPAACNLSVCGIPYWNSDIGGFFTGSFGGVGDPNWRRLYMRWMQFGTFTPMMRFHGTNTPREIYQFGREGDETGDFDHILKYVKMRYRMLPYLYSTAWQIHKADATFMRALAVAFNGDTDGYGVTDEYMFGESFLVAPIVQDAVTSRNVYLPADTKWIDFWTGETFDGRQTIKKQAHIDIIPLYVKAGSILPWGPDVQYSTEKKWDNLEIRVYPGADGSFTLYEDENDGYGYEEGQYTEIPFRWDDETQTLTIGARNGSFTGMLENRTFRIVKVSTRRGTGDLHATQYEATVSYNGTETQVVLDSKDSEVTLTDVTTTYIQNPSFEDDGRTLSRVAPKGWTVNCNTAWYGVNAGGGNGDPVATDGNYLFGVWDAKNTATADIRQTLTNLPAGTYRLTVDMHAPNKSGSVRIGNQRLYANDAVAYLKEQVTGVGVGDVYPLQTVALDFSVSEGSTVNIGVTTSDAPTETWFKIDNFRLYQVERPTLVLDENEDYLPEKEGIMDIDFVRTLMADKWNTLCVPFALDETQTSTHFAAVKSLSAIQKTGDSYSLEFVDATRIEAGIPYLVKPVAETSRQMFADAAVVTTDKQQVSVDGVNFVGTFNTTTVQNNEFFIYDNAFYRADKEVTVKGYRAYITVDPAIIYQSNIMRLNIDGHPTEVANAHADRPAAQCEVYTPLGVRVKTGAKRSEALNGLPSGLYIVNGEKVIK